MQYVSTYGQNSSSMLTDCLYQNVVDLAQGLRTNKCRGQ